VGRITLDTNFTKQTDTDTHTATLDTNVADKQIDTHTHTHTHTHTLPHCRGEQCTFGGAALVLSDATLEYVDGDCDALCVGEISLHKTLPQMFHRLGVVGGLE
jgi:hypothetical protein